MAELPTPHSIAVGTLISLYSDPNSPLVALDSWRDDDDDDPVDDDRAGVDRDEDRGVGGGVGGTGPPRSDAEWRLRLTSLLRQIVLNEDEGYVVLDPDAATAGEYGEDEEGGAMWREDGDPAAAGDRRDDDPGFDYLWVDPIRDCDYHHDDDDDDDANGHHRLLATGEGSFMADELGGGDGWRGIISFDDAPRPSFVGRVLRPDSRVLCAASLGFCMETLSTLLDRIDDVFYQWTGRRGGRRRRSPPSRALLSVLVDASASVDDLMNLLDSWHGLLAGTSSSSTTAAATIIISLDGESAFGVYLRRLCLGMEEIPFEGLGRLWDALGKFVAEETSSTSSPSSSSRRRRRQRGGRGDDGATGEDGGGEDGDDDADSRDEIVHLGGTPSCDWLPSSPQIERIVRNACIDIDFDAPSLSSGARSKFRASSGFSASGHRRRRDGSERRLHDLLETHPECPSVHFLLFLSSLASGCRTRALESLHRYFDYAMIHERKERAERALMLQVVAAGSEGGGAGAAVATTGIMGTMASGMGGITGGMTGGLVIAGHQQQQQQRAGAGGINGGGGNHTSGKILKESHVMQYAAILLAQTYHRFGYAQLSLQATDEAIRVAQQSGDVECVCFANAWAAFVSSTLGGYGDGGGGARRNTSVFARIGGFDGAVGAGVLARNRFLRPLAPSPSNVGGRRRRRDEEEAMLLRCRARASERGLSSLAAHASLELARRLAYRRHDAGSGNGYDGLGGNEDESSNGCVSSLAWDSIESAGRMPAVGGGGPSSTESAYGRVGHLSHHHRGASASMLSLGQPAPTDIYNVVPTEATSILGRQNTAIAGLWESTGHTSLASLSYRAAMYGTGGFGTNGGDKKVESMAINRVLSSFAYGPGLDVWQSSRTDPRCRGEVYAAILNRLRLLGDSEWTSSSSVAFSTLHEWSVRSCDLSLAQGMNTLLANCAAFPCPPSAVSGGMLPAVESALTFLMQSTHLCRQRGEFDRAKQCARRACWLATRHGLSFHHGWNLLQLALIDLECAPIRAPERALPPLLECLDLSERFSIDSLRALALSTLAKIFLYIGGVGGGVQRCQKARATIRAAMPLVMQHGHVWFQGEAYLNLAKTYLAEATAREKSHSSDNREGGAGMEKRNQQDPIAIELRQTALAELKRAALHYERIEDIQRLRQVYYLQARVCHLLPNSKKKRDDAAKMFMQLSLQARMCHLSPNSKKKRDDAAKKLYQKK